MKVKLYFKIFFLIGLLLISELANASTGTEDPAQNYKYSNLREECGISGGITKKCSPGLVCKQSGRVDAVVTSGFVGICIPNATSISLCRMLIYIVGRPEVRLRGNTIIQKFTLFAFVMLGIAFFLGKISWGMIISVIVGIILIFASERILKFIVSNNQQDWFQSSCVDLATFCTANGYSDSSGPVVSNKALGYVYDSLSVANKYQMCGDNKNKPDCTAYKCRGYVMHQKGFTRIISPKTIDKAAVTQAVKYTVCRLEPNATIHPFSVGDPGPTIIAQNCPSIPSDAPPESGAINGQLNSLGCTQYLFPENYSYFACKNPCNNNSVATYIYRTQDAENKRISSCKDIFKSISGG